MLIDIDDIDHTKNCSTDSNKIERIYRYCIYKIYS